MSYSKHKDLGIEVYLCWNCGKIHLEEIETQQCKPDYDFIERHLDKTKEAKKRK